MTSLRVSAETNALRHPKFVLYLIAIGCTSFAVQIMSVSVGWEIYDITRDPLYLGYVGLVQFLPPLLLVLVTGLAADRFNRRLIMAACLTLEALCALGLLLFTLSRPTGVTPVFGILALLGVGRAFMNPASDALAPNLVPKEAIAHAISLTTMIWQTANIAGPVAGGLLYGIGGAVAYGMALALVATAVTLIIAMGGVPQQRETEKEETTLGSLFAGFHFIRREKLVLGAISLDLFAVLLGGAVALLPVYARDILDVGPWGLGLLRAAPGVGAVTMALYLARYGIKDHAGRILFVFVALFGFFTMVFGLSTSVPMSIGALVLMGGLRHGERLYPRDAAAALDAGRGEGAGQCREPGVHRGVQRAGRVPRRHGGPADRRGCRRGAGRGRNHGGRLLLVALVPGAPHRAVAGRAGLRPLFQPHHGWNGQDEESGTEARARRGAGEPATGREHRHGGARHGQFRPP